MQVTKIAYIRRLHCFKSLATNSTFVTVFAVFNKYTKLPTSYLFGWIMTQGINLILPRTRSADNFSPKHHTNKLFPVFIALGLSVFPATLLSLGILAPCI